MFFAKKPPERILGTTLKEFIIGFGFFSGLWVAIGTSPEAEILKLLNQNIQYLPSNIALILVGLPQF